MKATFVATLATILVAYVSATRIVCPPVNGEDVTLLPNPHDCKTYYSCNEGIPHLMHCYVGLEFNPIERVCDWPEHAGCNATVPEPPHTPGSSPRPNEPGNPNDSLPNNGVGHPTDSLRPNKPPRPPKPACPAEAPEEPRPSEQPNSTELPRPTLPPRPATTTRRRPIWPTW